MAKRRRGIVHRVLRAIGDAGLTIGMSRGSHGQASKVHGDHLLARAALFDEGARGYDDRVAKGGLLDRVPGWVILLAFGIIVVAVLVLTSWQR